MVDAYFFSQRLRSSLSPVEHVEHGLTSVEQGRAIKTAYDHSSGGALVARTKGGADGGHGSCLPDIESRRSGAPRQRSRRRLPAESVTARIGL